MKKNFFIFCRGPTVFLVALVAMMAFLFGSTWAGMVTQDIAIEAIGTAGQDQLKGSSLIATSRPRISYPVYVLIVAISEETDEGKLVLSALTFIEIPAQARKEGIILNDIILVVTRFKSSPSPANYIQTRISGIDEVIQRLSISTMLDRIKGHLAAIVPSLSLSSNDDMRANCLYKDLVTSEDITVSGHGHPLRII